MNQSIATAIAMSAFFAAAGHSHAQCGNGKELNDHGVNALGTAAIRTVAHTEEVKAPNIVEVAAAAGNFKTLTAALAAADLTDALRADGPFTVFAPTDEAFAKLPKGALENLLKPENKAMLASILKYHVVNGAVKASAVGSLSNATTLNGQRIDVSARGGGVMVDRANVTKTDIEASNGVIHVIDSVLMPESKDLVSVAETAKFTTLVALVKAAGLSEALRAEGPFTVFAPTDEAFAKLPKATLEMLGKPENKDKLAAILKHHVVTGRVYSDAAAKLKEAKTLNGQTFQIRKQGESLMVDSAKVVQADIEASNGVIHVIDSVILPK